ncbi:hypothetical protein SAMN04488554_1270 [Ruania alba]|uniref:Uncharacterized protein n=1 Tax=Ruania alba TaxID=648782 RepID=A0A1H5F960_9MICO|nr:hypothetical protein SAMN04488554_1270 [Ruania alba]
MRWDTASIRRRDGRRRPRGGNRHRGGLPTPHGRRPHRTGSSGSRTVQQRAHPLRSLRRTPLSRNSLSRTLRCRMTRPRRRHQVFPESPPRGRPRCRRSRHPCSPISRPNSSVTLAWRRRRRSRPPLPPRKARHRRGRHRPNRCLPNRDLPSRRRSVPPLCRQAGLGRVTLRRLVARTSPSRDRAARRSRMELPAPAFRRVQELLVVLSRGPARRRSPGRATLPPRHRGAVGHGAPLPRPAHRAAPGLQAALAAQAAQAAGSRSAPVCTSASRSASWRSSSSSCWP